MKGLLGIALHEGIRIIYRNLLPNTEHFHGLYYLDPIVGHVVVLDKGLESKPRLHRCILAEEIGHYYTLSPEQALIPHTSFSYRRAISMTRAERKALRWACDYLMPVDKFLRAVHSGIVAVEELAEMFNVTEWMVYRRYEFLGIHEPKWVIFG